MNRCTHALSVFRPLITADVTTVWIFFPSSFVLSLFFWSQILLNRIEKNDVWQFHTQQHATRKIYTKNQSQSKWVNFINNNVALKYSGLLRYFKRKYFLVSFPLDGIEAPVYFCLVQIAASTKFIIHNKNQKKERKERKKGECFRCWAKKKNNSPTYHRNWMILVLLLGLGQQTLLFVLVGALGISNRLTRPI